MLCANLTPLLSLFPRSSAPLLQILQRVFLVTKSKKVFAFVELGNFYLKEDEICLISKSNRCKIDKTKASQEGTSLLGGGQAAGNKTMASACHEGTGLLGGGQAAGNKTMASLPRQRYLGGTRPRDSVEGSPPREPTSTVSCSLSSTASCSLKRRQETQVLANKRSKQFIRDAASVDEKDHALKTSKCCILTDTGRAALGRRFDLQEFRLTPEKVHMVVDDELNLTEVVLAHGYRDHAVVKTNYSSAAWCAYAAAVNVKNGYLSHKHVRGCPTNIRFRPGRLGPRRVDGKRTRPRDSEGLKKCCISGTILSAFNRIGLAMEPFAAEREKQAALRQQLHCSKDTGLCPHQSQQSICEQCSKTAALHDRCKHARPLYHMLPIFTRHILQIKDDKLRGRGYSNTLAPWNDKQGPQHSASVQESNTIRLDRELLMGGAARGIPGLALILAWLEWVYTGEQVCSFQLTSCFLSFSQLTSWLSPFASSSLQHMPC